MSRSAAQRAWDAVRPVIFWSHLAAGTVAGLVVLIMSVTGVALAYQRQTLEWIARRHAVPATAPERLPLDSLLILARNRAGERKVVGLTVRADQRMPVSAGLDDRSSLFLNPYTGAVLGTDAGPRGFFSAVERIHRSIVSRGTVRSETGTAVTGAANLAFLFLIVSGLFLWWPRRWSRQAFRSVLVFSRGAQGKARDWNWHHVLGFWSAPALILILASAAFISYDWPQRLVERALGQEPVAQGAPRGDRGGPGGRDGGPDASREPAPPVSLDRVWGRAMSGSGAWHTVQLRIPEGRGPVSVTVSHTGAFRPDRRTSLTVPAEGPVERRPYAELDPARRFRAWMRPLHTGEVAGIPGQTLAALVSLAAVVLVWTGIALAWRRTRAAVRRAGTASSTEFQRGQLEVSDA